MFTIGLNAIHIFGCKTTTFKNTSDTSQQNENPPICDTYMSSEEDFAPIQIVGGALPSQITQKTWSTPTEYTYTVAFSGNTNTPATHEGIDFVHDTETVEDVPILSSSEGTVVYIRSGCPQSSLFSFNQTLRECGSGWGNHIVIDHGDSIYTRYAHLAPDSILVSVGDDIEDNEHIALMGNSGRSDVRHLHFELGIKDTPFNPCLPSQSLDFVFDPAPIFNNLSYVHNHSCQSR